MKKKFQHPGHRFVIEGEADIDSDASIGAVHISTLLDQLHQLRRTDLENWQIRRETLLAEDPGKLLAGTIKDRKLNE